MDQFDPQFRNKSLARMHKIENERIYGQKTIRAMERIKRSQENERKPLVKKPFKNNAKGGCLN